MYYYKPLNQYIKVKEDSSTFDNNQLYWARRMQTNPLFSTSVITLLKKQHGMEFVNGVE